MKRTLIAEIGTNEAILTVCGWVQDIRILKNLSFLVLRDESGVCQVTVKNLEKPFDVASLNRESVILVNGMLVPQSQSKTGKEILASRITLLNAAKVPLPLAPFDKVQADLDTRLNNRFLDLRNPRISSIFRLKSSILWGIRNFLMQNGFVEVQTPKIVASATEGGANLFNVKYFEDEAFLSQSPQLYKEILISAGVGRVFEVGPAFRAEKHNTVIHLNEFTSVDIEMAFADAEDAMRMLEGVVDSAIQNILEANRKELEILGIDLKRQPLPYPRVEFSECLKILGDAGIKHDPEEDLTPEDLRVIAGRYSGFYFITKWPASVRPFYTMPDHENPEFTNSFDLQYQEKEITSGAQRVHDPAMLRSRFASKGLNPEDFDFYLKAFEYGMPPHSGWGLGLERLAMILLGLKNIRECAIFPRDRTRLKP